MQVDIFSATLRKMQYFPLDVTLHLALFCHKKVLLSVVYESTIRLLFNICANLIEVSRPGFHYGWFVINYVMEHQKRISPSKLCPCNQTNADLNCLVCLGSPTKIVFLISKSESKVVTRRCRASDTRDLEVIGHFPRTANVKTSRDHCVGSRFYG